VQIGDGVVEPIETVAEGGKLLVSLAQQADLLGTLAGNSRQIFCPSNGPCANTAPGRS